MSGTASDRPPPGIGRERQFEVYVDGARGAYPSVPVSFDRLEQKARTAMTPEGYAYIAGGAGTEETIRENRAAFERWRIVPRMLRDVSIRETSVDVLGTRMTSPFALCPIGVLEMAHRDADVAVARAAADEGVPFIFSNQASRPMEECAQAMGDARALVPALLEHLRRARHEPRRQGGEVRLLARSSSRSTRRCSAGASATSTSGTCRSCAARGSRSTRATRCSWRPCRRRCGRHRLRAVASRSRPSGRSGSSPARIRGHGSRASARGSRAPPCGGSSRPTRVRRSPGTTSRSCASGRACRSCSRASSTLRTRSWRSSTGWTGSSSPTTAAGRSTVRSPRWTRCPGSWRPSQGGYPSSLDSGVRSGADVFRALALGASAVGLGRPYVWGLAAGGQEGVREVIRNLRADFDLTMGLAGCAAVTEIGRDSVERTG